MQRKASVNVNALPEVRVHGPLLTRVKVITKDGVIRVDLSCVRSGMGRGEKPFKSIVALLVYYVNESLRLGCLPC